MENHHFLWENSLLMAIFNSFLYVYQRVIHHENWVPFSASKQLAPPSPSPPPARSSVHPLLPPKCRLARGSLGRHGQAQFIWLIWPYRNHENSGSNVEYIMTEATNHPAIYSDIIVYVRNTITIKKDHGRTCFFHTKSSHLVCKITLVIPSMDDHSCSWRAAAPNRPLFLFIQFRTGNQWESVELILGELIFQIGW